MMPLNNYFQFSDKSSTTENADQGQSILSELDKIKPSFPEEYNRLSELIRQGYIDTVHQIINHRKAIGHLKNLSSGI